MSGPDERATPGDRPRAEVPASLRYVNDDDPGLSRRRHGRGFSYRDPEGRRVTDPATLTRIRSLAIPPAWTGVWICPTARGHIQATGRDARGRKQYRYHPLWREVRDRTKYERTIAFGEALPRLRAQVERDLSRPGLGRAKVVATAVRLLDSTLMRVGNEEYARQNRSYGLTTLRDRHGQVRGENVRFSFRGKGGKRHDVDLRDARLARIVRRCQELPGQRLFQYVDEQGRPQPIDSDDVNEYLRRATGAEFSARDFRTWAGTVLAFRCLRAGQGAAEASTGRPANGQQVPHRRAKRHGSSGKPSGGRLANGAGSVTGAIGEVARWLGNTPAVCRSSYIHPRILEAYAEGGFARRRRGASGEILRPPVRHGLGADEREVLALLRAVQEGNRA